MGSERGRPPPQSTRRFCHVPECLKQRDGRGQRNGRFLVEYTQDETSVYVTVVCADCGAQHIIEIVKQ